MTRTNPPLYPQLHPIWFFQQSCVTSKRFCDILRDVLLWETRSLKNRTTLFLLCTTHRLQSSKLLRNMCLAAGTLWVTRSAETLRSTKATYSDRVEGLHTCPPSIPKLLAAPSAFDYPRPSDGSVSSAESFLTHGHKRIEVKPVVTLTSHFTQ